MYKDTCLSGKMQQVIWYFFCKYDIIILYCLPKIMLFFAILAGKFK